MTSIPWECDICEEPRYSAQMFQCMTCYDTKEFIIYVGYCCKKKHIEEKHPGETAVFVSVQERANNALV